MDPIAPSPIPLQRRLAQVSALAAACAMVVVAVPSVAHAATPVVPPPPIVADPGAPAPTTTPVPAADDPMPPLGPAAPPSAIIGPPCAGVDPSAPPDDRRRAAEAEIARAEDLFREGDVPGALAAVSIAECQSPHPDDDFMRGVIYVSAGECEKANAAMKRFLASAPPNADANAARERLGSCSDGAAPPPPVLPQSSVDTTPPATPRARDDARPWHRDPAGATLLGVGVAGLVVGTGLLVAKNREEGRSSGDYGSFADRTKKIENLKIGAGVTFAIASAAIVGSVIRYALVARDARQRNVARRHARARGLARR